MEEGGNSPMKFDRNSRSKQYEYHETEGFSPLKNNQTPTRKDSPSKSSGGANKKKTVIFHPEPAYISEDGGSAHIQISPFTVATPSVKDDIHSGSPSLRRSKNLLSYEEFTKFI